MKNYKAFKRMAALLCALAFYGSLPTFAAQVLRPPSVPLVACDPYFSIWSPGDRLTDVDTTHWTGKPQRLTSLTRIDGKAFRLMGKESVATKTFHGPFEGDDAFHAILSGPRQIPVIVAGAKNAAISMVVRIFGEWSGTAVPVVEKK